MEKTTLKEIGPESKKKRGGRRRAKIPLETLKEEGSSFLCLGEEPLLRRLEMVKEHGLQDLHRVIEGGEEGEKKRRRADPL